MRSICVVFVATLTCLVGFAPRAVTADAGTIPFETIERRLFSGTGALWESREPGLVLIADVSQTPVIDDLVTPEAEVELESLDYSKFFALAVFLGWKSNLHEGVEILQLQNTDDSVSVVAVAGEETWENIVSSPYHLVKVEKVGEWNTDIEFVLAIDGEVVLTQTHFIPEIHPLYLPVIHTTDTE